MSAATALAHAPRTQMIVESELLGTLTVPDEEVIRFPTGLFGFPDHQDFLLLPAEQEGLYWLQSTESEALAFLLADPFVFFDGFSVELSPGDRHDLRANEASEIAVLAIVTLPRSPREQPTANLQGPLALNLKAQRAKQLAIPDSDFGLRAPLDLTKAAARA